MRFSFYAVCVAVNIYPLPLRIVIGAPTLGNESAESGDLEPSLSTILGRDAEKTHSQHLGEYIQPAPLAL